MSPGPRTAGSASRNNPRYEIRLCQGEPGGGRYEIWQVPCAATPHLTAPILIGALGGRNLELVRHRVLRQLDQARIRLAEPGPARVRRHVPESMAVTLGLMFRALAPMHSRNHIRAVAEGVQAMESEEASYWLGMAMHRKHPRRVLAALRLLLTAPGDGRR